MWHLRSQDYSCWNNWLISVLITPCYMPFLKANTTMYCILHLQSKTSERFATSYGIRHLLSFLSSSYKQSNTLCWKQVSPRSSNWCSPNTPESVTRLGWPPVEFLPTGGSPVTISATGPTPVKILTHRCARWIFGQPPGLPRWKFHPPGPNPVQISPTGVYPSENLTHRAEPSEHLVSHWVTESGVFKSQYLTPIWLMKCPSWIFNIYITDTSLYSGHFFFRRVDFRYREVPLYYKNEGITI